MNSSVLFNIGYGLYVLTANEGSKDNGCIINTVMQVTSEPLQIGFAVNKQNYTNEMISRTKKFNISILTEKSTFDTFKCFGYQSGRSTNKFSNYEFTRRSPNGVLYITKDTNSYISGYVKQEIDLNTHTLFIAELVAAEILSGDTTVSYSFYQKNIKPKVPASAKKGWRCKICNFVYEGETLPDDYICPICKHGAVDFEEIK